METFTEKLIDNFFDCTEVWEVAPGLYEMREVGRGRKTVRYEKSRSMNLGEIRRRAYDFACVESDCRNNLSG